MRKRRRVSLMGVNVWLAPPEYIILWKLEFHREGGGDKHIRDIQGILAVSGDDLDDKLLAEAISTLGLSRSWEICRGGGLTQFPEKKRPIEDKDKQ